MRPRTIGKTTRWWLAATVAGGLVTTGFATLNDSSAAVSSASTTGIQMAVNAVPNVGLSSYANSWGKAQVVGEIGEQQADYSGLTEMQRYVSVDDPYGRAGSPDGDGWGASQYLTNLRMRLQPDGPFAISIPRVRSIAMCQLPYASAANTYVEEPTSFGTSIKDGKTEISVSGDQLGLTGVDSGQLIVTLTQTKTATVSSAA